MGGGGGEGGGLGQFMYGMCEQELALSILYIMQRIVRVTVKLKSQRPQLPIGAALIDKYYMNLHASNACI